MPKENGYCIDRCIAEEIMALWMLGIKTTGCCCGHNTDAAFIGVDFGDIQRMKEMGYVPIHNPHRPGDEDSFLPMGAKHAETILLKYLGMDTTPLEQRDNEPQDIRRESLTLHIQNHQLREQIARQEEQIKTLLVQVAENGTKEAIAFGKWLEHTDNGTIHFNPHTKKESPSIGFSPYDCFTECLMDVKSLYNKYKQIEGGRENEEGEQSNKPQ
ncbi:hypothetical protein ACTJJB_01820 [Chitinophaga sp. 22536]|uniref:hypothetical protein n=1 Tax=unclassified Chitinophaga TaxID=2619133 RepID=UPI003F833F3C